jgi:transcriptional regulator GlxA family with amidase domain
VSDKTFFMLFKTKGDFSILILPGANPSSVSVTVDILSTAAVLAAQTQNPAPQWQVLSLTGGQIALQNGISILTQKLRQPKSRTTLILPGLGIGNSTQLLQRLAQPDIQRLAPVLRTHARGGGICAASCSSVFVLQHAGLLRGREATTSWWLASTLQKLEPSCRVLANTLVCDSGQLITAGAALAQTDLMLFLLKTHCSAELANNVARFMLLDQRKAQAGFVLPEMLANGNPLLSTFVQLVEDSFPEVPPVSILAAQLGVSERSLSRHMKRTAGLSPVQMIQLSRFRRAQELLEHRRLSVDAVAEAVGYQDATALRRMLKKMSGRNPTAFR